MLGNIDEILAWEKTKEQERDVCYVDLGRYLCEVRIGQYCRLERLKSFDEFLERRLPESRRKAYYIMTIHEHLTQIPKRELKQIRWTKARDLVRVARADGQRFDCAPCAHKARELPREEFQRAVQQHVTGKESEAWELLLQGLQKSIAGH